MAVKIVKDSYGLVKELVNDTINRKDAIDALNKLDVSDGVGISAIACDLQEEAIRSIENLPSAQSESKAGKWIEAYDPFNRISGRCSVCGWEAHLYEDDVVGMNYCPNCGTRMEGEIK